MTDFERQVAEALAHDPRRHVDDFTGDTFVNLKGLSERVAAALEGIAERYRQLWESEMATDFAGGLEVKKRRLEEALAALRGSP